MVAALLVLIIWLLFCGLLFGIWGIPIGIVSFIGVIIYEVYKEKKSEKESYMDSEPMLEPKPEPFCTPIATEDVLAMYCADKVVNKRFKL